MLKDKRIGVIGAGIMGQALVQGLMAESPPKSIWASVRSEKSRAKAQEALGIPVITQYVDHLPQTDLLLVCVKPTMAMAVCDKVRGQLPKEAPVISIVAGVSIAELQTSLGANQPVIRAMPNTPCQVRSGMTVISRGDGVTDAQMALAQEIFQAVGHCLELDESHMDAVTGLSGSGPAFAYLVMEALADGGVKVGLPRDVAMELVVQSVLGSALMIRHTKRHPAALRDEVTTPAGCTISGLLALEDGKIRSVLARAVEEAATVAGGLGKK